MKINTPRVIIEICQRKIGHGWAKLYISYTPTLIDMSTGASMDKEDLGIKVFTNPENQAQLKYNKARYSKAYAILNQRQLEFNEGHIRLLSTDFISFYRHLAATKSYNLTASLKQLIKFTGDKCSFSRITASFIREYQTFLECRSVTSKGKLLTNSTVALYMNQMMTVCRQAITKGYMSESDISGVSFSHSPIESHHVSLAELKILYRCQKRDYRVERLLSLNLLTGLPFTYLLKLDAQHLSSDNFGNWVLDVQGKRGKKIHISNEAAEIIRDITDGKSIFEGMSYPEVNGLFIQWITQAGLKKTYRLHNFRLQIDSLCDIV
jgi:hypothetical protein